MEGNLLIPHIDLTYEKPLGKLTYIGKLIDTQTVVNLTSVFSLNRSLDISSYEFISRAPSTDQAYCVLWGFWFYLFVGILCLLGLAGNTLSILVLRKDNSHRVAALLLEALAAADNLVLITSLVVLVLWFGMAPYLWPNSQLQRSWPYVVKYVQPVGYMAHTLTIWITVLLAVNRYLAVCKPFLVHRACTLGKLRIQLIAAFLFALIFNAPRFLQVSITLNMTKSNHTFLGIEDTAIGEHTLFGIIYTNALYTILVMLLPFVILLFLNTRIIREMRVLKRNRWQVAGVSGNLRGERSITVVMVTVVLVFLVCHTPDRVCQILRNHYTDHSCPTVMFYVSNFCNLLIILSSSTNFIIYYILRPSFRQILCHRVRNLFSEETTPRPDVQMASLKDDGSVTLVQL